MRKNRLFRGVSAVALVALMVLSGCQFLPAPPASADVAPEAVAESSQVEPGAVEVSPQAEALDGNVIASLETALQGIYENVSPSVVYIEVWKPATSGFSLEGLPFDFPAPDQPLEDLPLQQGSGSGFVWDEDGHIVTNNHVVAGAEKIRVTFSDGTMFPATLVGGNSDSDLAVIQVEAPTGTLSPVTMGDSDVVKVGEVAVAIGNPFGLESTMTVGFISGLGRSLPVQADTLGGPTYSIPDVIQTDAPINPGNSGGVLLNDQGEVIGVTTAIASASGSSAGVGFVVPSAIVRQVVPALIDEGRYAVPWLGISGATLVPELAEAMDLPANQRGVLVAEVMEDSPAGTGGLRGSDREVTIDGQPTVVGGDVIIALDDQPVRTFEDLSAYLFRETSVGQEITVTVLRDGAMEDLTVTLQERPSSQPSPIASAEPDEDEGQVASATWMGIRGVTLVPDLARALDLPEDQEGVLVVEVVEGGPADAAGLRASDVPFGFDGGNVQLSGDVIVGWNGDPIADVEQLRDVVAQADPGDEVTVTVLRDGERLDLTLTLEARPTP